MRRMLTRALGVAALVAAGAATTTAGAQTEEILPPPPPPTRVVVIESEVPDRQRCSVEELFNCLDGVGGGVTSLDTLRVGASSRGGARSLGEQGDEERARLLVPGASSGVSAGAHEIGGWTLWGGGGFADYDSDVAIAPYEANAYSLLFGADRFFGERFLAGINVGYDKVKTRTLYNGGGQDRDGFNVGLYAAYLINDVFSVDAAAGYGTFSTDEDRIDTGSGRAGPPTPGALIRGSYDSERAYGTVNVNAVKVFDSWVVGGRVGWLYAVESQDAYSETGGTGRRTIGDRHVDLTQMYGSLDVGYSLGEFEPYALIEYRNDFGRDDGASAGGLPAGVRPQPDDDDEWQGGLGVRFFGDNGVSGSLEWLHTWGRDNFDSDTVNLTIRMPL